MRVLFVMRHEGMARNFESTLRSLAERGHEVHVALDRPFAASPPDGRASILERLAADYPSITFGAGVDRSREAWWALGLRLRRAVDYLRFFGPRYAAAPKLRARAQEQVGILLRGVSRAAARRRQGPRTLTRVLRALDASLPLSAGALRLVLRQRPDAVLVTPLIELGGPQTDYVRAAKALGVPTGLCVASWDNLTNRGVVAEVPELVAVWNEAQRSEAIELHGIPAARVLATGAQSYDHWFEWGPARDGSQFAAEVGLPEDRPLLLYLCSSPFIAPHEAAFVRRWLEMLRSRAEPELQEAGVLIRPHPQHAEQWRSADLSGLGPVSIWPPGGADPVDRDSRRDYFDSIYHCRAVVGVNTSALIESAIVGRPVFTYLDATFRDTQEGTLHFAHLTEGGPLSTATTFDEHAAQLAAALAGREDPDRGRSFVRSFVRPHGLDQPATPRLVEAIERLSATRVVPPRRPPLAPVLRAALLPFAAVTWLDASARREVREGIHRGLRRPAARRFARRAALPLARRIRAAQPLALELEAALDEPPVGAAGALVQRLAREPAPEGRPTVNPAPVER